MRQRASLIERIRLALIRLIWRGYERQDRKHRERQL